MTGTLLASPDGKDNALTLYQNASVYLLDLDKDLEKTVPATAGADDIQES